MIGGVPLNEAQLLGHAFFLHASLFLRVFMLGLLNSKGIQRQQNIRFACPNSTSHQNLFQSVLPHTVALSKRQTQMMVRDHVIMQMVD